MRASRILLSMVDGFVFFIFLMGVIFVGVSYLRAEKDKGKIADMAPCTEDATATVTHLNIFTERVDKDDIDSPTYKIYDADYTFTVDGKEYKGNYNSKKEIQEGDIFEIKYDPNDPNHCYLKSEIAKNVSSEGDIKKTFFFYPGIFLIALSLIIAIPLAILQIIFRIKENKKRDEEYRLAVERHQAEMAQKKLNNY